MMSIIRTRPLNYSSGLRRVILYKGGLDSFLELCGSPWHWGVVAEFCATPLGPSPVALRAGAVGEMLSQVCCAAEWIQGMALGTLPVHSSAPALMLQWAS